MRAAEVDDGRDFHQHVDRLIRAMDRLLTESKLSGLAQKSESAAIRDIAAPLPMRDQAVAPEKQVEHERDIEGGSHSKNSAAFSSFFCEQTLTSARIAMLAGLASWILTGATAVTHEMLAPAMIVVRGLVGIPVVFAFFAASYLSFVQRYWQTFLVAICIINGLVLFGAAWVSYRTDTSFELEKWAMACVVVIGIGALIPLRFFYAIGIGVYAAGLINLFLILANQPLLSSAWMQSNIAVAVLVLCAIAYFREQLLWALFQTTEVQKAARAGSTK